MQQRRILACAVVAVMLSSGVALGFEDVPDWVKQSQVVLRNPGLTPAEKILKLDAIIPADVPLSRSAGYLARAAPVVAQQRLLAGFRNPDLEMSERLRIARRLLHGRPDSNAVPLPGFEEQYILWLIKQVLSRPDDLTRAVPHGTLTPIGELTFIAAGWMGHDEALFAKLKDQRLIPILIRALDMPDDVYPEDQGHAVHGVPGEPTGRNLARQLAPVALAHLGATESIPALIDVLKHHPDWYLRDNAAYALGFLLAEDGRAAIVRYLESRSKDTAEVSDWSDIRRYHLYAFGRGLVDTGDDSGLQYFASKYSVYYGSDDPSEIRYMINQRLEELQDVRSPKSSGFVKSLFDDDIVWVTFVADRGVLAARGDGPVGMDTTPAWIIELHDRLCDFIEAKALGDLKQQLAALADATRDEAIRQRTRQCIDKLTTDD